LKGFVDAPLQQKQREYKLLEKVSQFEKISTKAEIKPSSKIEQPSSKIEQPLVKNDSSHSVDSTHFVGPSSTASSKRGSWNENSTDHLPQASRSESNNSQDSSPTISPTTSVSSMALKRDKANTKSEGVKGTLDKKTTLRSFFNSVSSKKPANQDGTGTSRDSLPTASNRASVVVNMTSSASVNASFLKGNNGSSLTLRGTNSSPDLQNTKTLRSKNLFDAAKFNLLEEAKELLEKKKLGINGQDNEGWTGIYAKVI
jgi:hypothetical protein